MLIKMAFDCTGILFGLNYDWWPGGGSLGILFSPKSWWENCWLISPRSLRLSIRLYKATLFWRQFFTQFLLPRARRPNWGNCSGILYSLFVYCQMLLKEYKTWIKCESKRLSGKFAITIAESVRFYELFWADCQLTCFVGILTRARTESVSP